LTVKPSFFFNFTHFQKQVNQTSWHHHCILNDRTTYDKSRCLLSVSDLPEAPTKVFNCGTNYFIKKTVTSAPLHHQHISREILCNPNDTSVTGNISEPKRINYVFLHKHNIFVTFFFEVLTRYCSVVLGLLKWI
jgi:hypothetical protein